MGFYSDVFLAAGHYNEADPAQSTITTRLQLPLELYGGSDVEPFLELEYVRSHPATAGIRIQDSPNQDLMLLTYVFCTLDTPPSTSHRVYLVQRGCSCTREQTREQSKESK